MGNLPSQGVIDLFHEAVELPADQRDSFLSSRCGQDSALRSAVEELLRNDTSETIDDAFRSPVAMHREARDVDAPPTQIGPYRIISSLGQGGMGTVYMANQLRPVKRLVAIKVIKLGMDTREIIARFDAERQALAMMDHPSIARVYDAGATEAGRPYFVMEFVRGLPITRYCDDKKLAVRNRLELYIKLCDAIQHAHMKGIIHRDLKPGNILVTEIDGIATPKIIDFGIAKATIIPLTEHSMHTGLGQMLGTPEYMSPEQARPGPEDVDTRSDVYSLGAVLYELLSGSQPFDAATLRSGDYQELARIIRDVDPPRPSTRISSSQAGSDAVAAMRQESVVSLSRRLRGELEWIPLKAMRKEREQRYRSAAELADDVRAYLDGRPLIAAPESHTYRFRKFLKRNRRAVVAAAAMFILLIAGIIGTSVQAIRATRAERLAKQEKAQAEQRFNDVRALARGMLFDLQHDVSKLAGSQDATRKIIDLGKTYLEKLQAEKSTDIGLICDVAGAYGKLGDIQGRSNVVSFDDVPAMRKSWEKSLELAQRALRLDPKSPLGMMAVATAEIALADADRDSGAPDRAVERFSRAIELYSRASELQPNDIPTRINVAITRARVARLDYTRSRIADAVKRQTAAVEELAAIVRDAPDNRSAQSMLSDALSSLASYQNRNGDTQGGEKTLAEANSLLESLLKTDASNSSLQLQLADNCVVAARAANARGDAAAERRSLSRAIELGRALVAMDSTSRPPRMSLAHSLFTDSEFKAARREFGPADQSLSEVIAILEKALSLNPDDGPARSLLSVCYGARGHQLEQQQKYDDAIAAITRAADLIRIQAKRDPTNVRFQAGLAFYELLTGVAQMKAGRADDAIVTLRRAVAQHETAVASAPDDAVNRRSQLGTQRALAQALASKLKHPDTNKTQAESLRVEALSLAIKARDEFVRLTVPGQPSSPDTQAVKEFNELIAELERPTTRPQ